ncbi:MAG: hypothetical protein Q7J67_07460 [bacterium]|nr:hypothetical protein [bacterium]
MKIRDIVRILEAEILCCENCLGKRILDFAASDLLSDVLAYEKENYLLLTGLTSQQVVRTAEITGAVAIVFVRGKLPPQEAIGLAKSHHIPLLMTDKSMFDSCRKITEELSKEKNK